MKQFSVIVTAILFCFSVAAQNPIDAVIQNNKHRIYKERAVLRLSPLAISLFRPFLKKEDAWWLKKVHGIDLIAIENGMQAPPYNLLTQKFQRRRFEPLISLKNKEAHVHIIAKTNAKNVIKQVVLFAAGEDENMIMLRIWGRLTPEDVDKISAKLNDTKGDIQLSKAD